MEDLKIRLVLEGAEQVQAGAAKAGEGLQRFGVAGAKAGQQVQLSGQQIAQVSAQLQDLFIQIQGGQAPLTAFLQQGSQLSAQFGGVGNALRAVGSVVTPTVAVLGGVVTAVTLTALAYKQGSEEATAYGRALVFSGNAAGVTVGHLQAMAAAQARVVSTQASAAASLTALAATGQVSAASLGTAAEAASRLARVGVPIEETAKKFAALGKEPLKALIQLNEAENFLTESVYRQVKALEERGRKTEAAAVAQREYARVGIERAEALENQLGYLERAWAGVKSVAKGAWDAMLDVGRTGNVNDAAIQALRSRIAANNFDAAQGGQTAIEAARRGNPILVERLRLLEQGARYEALNAAYQAQYAAQTKATIKADEDAAEAVKKVAAALEQENTALERARGLTGSYQKDLEQLVALRQKGRLSEEQYVEAVRKVITQQPVVREQMEAEAKLQREAIKAREDYIKSEEHRLEALQRSGDQVAEQLLKLQTEEQAVALVSAANITLAEAIERVTIARLREQQSLAAQEGRQEELDALQREINARNELAEVAARKEYRDAAKRSAEEAAREWQRASAQIEQSLTDALLRGFESGKGFAANLRDTLRNMFNTLVLRPILQPVVSSIAGILGVGGSTPAAAAAGAGQGGSALSALGALGSLSALTSIFKAGAAMTGWTGAGTGVALEGAGAMIGSGSIAQGIAQGLGALAPWAGGAAAGVYGGRAISNGFSAWGSSGNRAVNAGTAIGAAIAGPIGAALGGALGGVFNRAFGTKMVYGDGGITGSISAGDALGQNYQDWTRKGGWFRSTKRGTDYSALTADQGLVLDQGAQAVFAQAQSWAKALSLPAEELARVTTSFRIKLGSSAEENQKLLADLFTRYQEELAGRFQSALQPYQKAGEQLSLTFSRLATLETFSKNLNTLGGVFSRLAGASVDAREQLIALTGGMDALSQQAASFVQNYYSREEIAGLKAAELQTALGKAGIAALPNSREEFRALVESLNPDSSTGREQIAALLQLQGSFATVADYLAETGLSLSQAAAQAPASDLFTPLLSTTSQQLQLAQQSTNALYEINDSTRMVVNAVERLTSVIESSGSAGGSRFPGYRQPEVGLAN